MNEHWQIPATWRWNLFSTVASIVGGGTPRSDKPEYFGGNISWITPADLSGYTKKFISVGERSITQTGLENSGAQLMPAGTVLFSSRAPIGYVAIAANPLSTSQGFKSFVLNESVNSDYVYYYLQHAKKLAIAMASGTTFLEISGKKIAQIPIPIAPLAEQKRIVAEIEKQFTRLDSGIAALRRIQANLKRYRSSVLKAACEGRLTSTEAEIASRENRRYESANMLLAQAVAPSRPNRWKSRSKDKILGHAGLSVGNFGTGLPEGWAWSALVEIAKMESGHTPSRNHPEWWNGDVPWIGIADARNYHGRTIHETIQHTNTAGLANSAARILPAGTVCISRTASVGYVVVMGKEMATSQDFVNWTPTEAVTSGWLRIIFSADREALRRFGKGSIHKTIYFPEWLSVYIAVPPLAEQRRIVMEVDRRLSLLEELDTIVCGNLRRASRLRQSLLQKAFSGKLVPQDPNDAPVEAILSRPRDISRTPPKESRSKIRAPRTMKSETISSLDDLVARIRTLGDSATPERLLMSSGLSDDMEKFFDLLRLGHNTGALDLPFGEAGFIRVVKNAN